MELFVVCLRFDKIQKSIKLSLKINSKFYNDGGNLRCTGCLSDNHWSPSSFKNAPTGIAA